MTHDRPDQKNVAPLRSNLPPVEIAPPSDDPEISLAPDLSAGSKATPRQGPVVSLHIMCQQCQYDLFKLPLSHVCPECGHPVQPSIDASWEVQKLVAAKRKTRRIIRAMVMLGLFLVVLGYIFRPVAYFLIFLLLVGAIVFSFTNRDYEQWSFWDAIGSWNYWD